MLSEQCGAANLGRSRLSGGSEAGSKAGCRQDCLPYFGSGTRRRSSSNQFNTTRISVC